MAQRRNVPVDGAVLLVHETGAGEPLLLVQTALAAEELVPLGRHPLVSASFRVLDLRRRGYAVPSEGGVPAAPGCGGGSAQPSVLLDAADCARALEDLAAEPAHVLGTSYSAAVALELATGRPELVRSLTLIEPPPSNVAASAEFRSANRALLTTYEEHGVTAALEQFSTALGTPSWLEERSRQDPAVVARVERDAGVFFTRDVPALLTWTYDADTAPRYPGPVLYVGGAESGPWFREVHDWVHALFPDAEHHVLAGAGHTVVSTHTDEVARLLVAFLSRTGRSGGT